MNVLVLHAHPDDECVLTGGILARSVQTGCRTMVFFGTSGELGDRFGWPSLPDVKLARLREGEAEQSLCILGITDHAFLRYPDSGYKRTAHKSGSRALCKQDPQHVARTVVDAVDQPIDLILTYDPHGTYGHPDHMFMSRVGDALVDHFPDASLMHTSFNRDYILSVGQASSSAFSQYTSRRTHLGLLEQSFSFRLDVEAYSNLKRQAISVHRSQQRPGSLVDAMLSCSDREFAALFSKEWFISRRKGSNWGYVKARFGFFETPFA
jgi:LmbE family N-acetylglucosaminyl deacetylase